MNEYRTYHVKVKAEKLGTGFTQFEKSGEQNCRHDTITSGGYKTKTDYTQ
jgi:hypothetical protein